MAVSIHCPHCGNSGRASDRVLGLTVRCVKCGNQFSVSTPTQSGQGDQKAPPKLLFRRILGNFYD